MRGSGFLQRKLMVAPHFAVRTIVDVQWRKRKSCQSHPSCAVRHSNPKPLRRWEAQFVATCEALGLSDRADPMTKLVAQKIIELAQRGFKTDRVAFSRDEGI